MRISAFVGCCSSLLTRKAMRTRPRYISHSSFRGATNRVSGLVDSGERSCRGSHQRDSYTAFQDHRRRMPNLTSLMKQRIRRTPTVGSDASTFLSTSSGASSQRATVLGSPMLSPATETLEDWMYWQRDAANARCWTKVYGVLDNEFLWLFKGNHSSRTMFLQIAVSSVEVSGQRQLRIVDPNGEDMEIWLLDEDSFATWRRRLEDAAALTTQFFRMTELEARRLPRNSAYRGSLVTYRRASKRTRYRAALDWMRRKFRPPTA